MKIFHILNPSRRRWDEVVTLVESRRLTSPWAWVAREHPDHTETLVQWALQEGIGRLVVWGGDGTLHRVVKALWDQKALDRVELALVPAGTCNDLARRMRLRFEGWPAWQAGDPEGRRARMSLGRISAGGRSDVFINNAGFGRPKASFDRKDSPWRTLASFAPIPLSARWEAGELRGIYYMGLFCLGPYFSGGLHFEPEHGPEREDVRTFLVPARSKARLAARLLLGRLGRPLADAKITAFSADKFTIHARTPVWPQVDGEPPVDPAVSEISVSVLPKAWTLRVLD